MVFCPSPYKLLDVNLYSLNYCFSHFIIGKITRSSLYCNAFINVHSNSKISSPYQDLEFEEEGEKELV